jgi:hypothetical protein
MGWIDVGDRLPAIGLEVLAVALEDGDETYWLARCFGEDNWVEDYGGECWPSHWMLLPDAPKEE